MSNKSFEKAIKEEISKAESRNSPRADSHYSDELNGYIRGLSRALDFLYKEWNDGPKS